MATFKFQITQSNQLIINDEIEIPSYEIRSSKGAYFCRLDNIKTIFLTISGIINRFDINEDDDVSVAWTSETGNERIPFRVFFQYYNKKDVSKNYCFTSSTTSKTPTVSLSQMEMCSFELFKTNILDKLGVNGFDTYDDLLSRCKGEINRVKIDDKNSFFYLMYRVDAKFDNGRIGNFVTTCNFPMSKGISTKKIVWRRHECGDIMIFLKIGKKVYYLYDTLNKGSYDIIDFKENGEQQYRCHIKNYMRNLSFAVNQKKETKLQEKEIVRPNNNVISLDKKDSEIDFHVIRTMMLEEVKKCLGEKVIDETRLVTLIRMTLKPKQFWEK